MLLHYMCLSVCLSVRVCVFVFVCACLCVSVCVWNVFRAAKQTDRHGLDFP
jgi:hypothetical protein